MIETSTVVIREGLGLSKEIFWRLPVVRNIQETLPAPAPHPAHTWKIVHIGNLALIVENQGGRITEVLHVSAKSTAFLYFPVVLLLWLFMSRYELQDSKWNMCE